jgi:hypothetical protein
MATLVVPAADSYSACPPSLLESPWPSLHPPAPSISCHVEVIYLKVTTQTTKLATFTETMLCTQTKDLAKA